MIRSHSDVLYYSLSRVPAIFLCLSLPVVQNRESNFLVNRAEHKPIQNLQDSSSKHLRKIRSVTTRRESGGCNADLCCDTNYFCQNYVFECVSCSQCQFNSDSIDNDCISRCSQAQDLSDILYPSILWIYMNTRMVDASRFTQNVDLIFAVQDDVSGMLQAEVSLNDRRP